MEHRENRKDGARPALKRIVLFAGGPLAALLVLVGAWYVWGEPKDAGGGSRGILMNHQFKKEVVGADCTLCHQASDADPRLMTFPDHETCGACHAEALDEASPDKNCALCHNQPGNQTRLRRNLVLSPLVRFDHQAHQAQGVSCESCHAVVDSDVLTGDEMLPKMDTCLQCHADRKVADAKDCSSCHVKGWEKIEPPSHTGRWVADHGEGLSLAEIRQTDTSCLSCHSKAQANSCTQCHHKKEFLIGRTDACDQCHGTGFDRKRPKDHTALWLTSHGERLPQAKIDSNCALCHASGPASDCQSCHQQENPPSHTVAWKLKSHGSQVRLDRQSCATCHQQSECISCHTTEEPSSHTGLWGSPNDRHCLNCHMEGNNYAAGAVGGNCSFCHQSGQVYASHQSLPRPAGHAADSCTNCHRVSGSLADIRHPYPPSALQCLSCHQ